MYPLCGLRSGLLVLTALKWCIRFKPIAAGIAVVVAGKNSCSKYGTGNRWSHFQPFAVLALWAKAESVQKRFLLIEVLLRTNCRPYHIKGRNSCHSILIFCVFNIQHLWGGFQIFLPVFSAKCYRKNRRWNTRHGSSNHHPSPGLQRCVTLLYRSSIEKGWGRVYTNSGEWDGAVWVDATQVCEIVNMRICILVSE